jgi:DNA-binding transcriptional ArsR family regulator
VAGPSNRSQAVFDALGDPTRRELLAAIGAAGAGGATATELAAERPISRQAIVKHLQVLVGAGLLAVDQVGREHRHRLEPAPLVDAAGWLTSVGAAWDRRLDRLARPASEERR